MSRVYFTEEHEWINVDKGVGIVGITDYAQNALGDVVYVELPTVGAELEKGDEAAVVESVKAASEIYAPVTGEVLEVNEELEGEPSKVNADPMEGGWIFKVKIADKLELDDLMDETTYLAFVEGLE